MIPQCTLCIISSLNINKTSARFSTSNKILILLKKNISKQLAELFNLSFLSGSFPCILKTTKVVPVFKKDSKLDYCNYHTILQYTQYNLQFGFRQKISTSHALNNITERLTKDLQKAFQEWIMRYCYLNLTAMVFMVYQILVEILPFRALTRPYRGCLMALCQVKLVEYFPNSVFPKFLNPIKLKNK